MASETLSYTELKNWYNTFNSVITNYGGGVASLDIPSQGKAQPSDVNNLLNKITELAEEEYLGTQSSLYDTDYSVVVKGNKIMRSSITPISNTAINIGQIKCRNKITYSCGANNSGNNSNGTEANGAKTNSLCSSGAQSSGTQSSGVQSRNSNQYGNTQSYGSKSNGNKSNQWNSNGYSCSNQTCSSGSKSNVEYSNGTIIDILNANSSY